MPILHLTRRARLSLILALTTLFGLPTAHAQAKKSAPKAAGSAVLSPNSPWLFIGFKKNGEDGMYYAISVDGYHWKLANGGKPVCPPTEPGELMRDPFIQRAPDGNFRMVWTWAWYDPQIIGYSESRDLLTWTPHRKLSVMASQPGALNVWAPALYYEPAQKQWLILWASTIPGRFPGDDSGDYATTAAGKTGLNHRIFSITTADFHTFSPARIFFDPGYSVIDATILPPTTLGKPYTMIFKDERKNPLKKHLLTATGPSFEGPWSNISEPISETWSEGAAIIPVAAANESDAGYLAYYDHYSQGQHYGALFSPDLVHWSNALSKIEFPAGLRHGSFLQITQAEYDRLSTLTSPQPATSQVPAQ
jgi:hypothetical protein